jgi:hypothetical protein
MVPHRDGLFVRIRSSTIFVGEWCGRFGLLMGCCSRSTGRFSCVDVDGASLSMSLMSSMLRKRRTASVGRYL